MKYLLLILPLLAGVHLFAQSSANYTSSIQVAGDGSDAFQFLRFDLDHGPTPQAITLDMTVNCTGGQYIMASLADWDERIAQSQHLHWTYVGPSVTVSPGQTLPLQTTTPVRSGVHPIVVRVNNFNVIARSDFVINLSANAGTLTGPQDSVHTAGPLAGETSFQGGVAAAYYDTFVQNYPAMVSEVELDFGAAGHARTLMLWVQGQRIERVLVEIPDGSGGVVQTSILGDVNGVIPNDLAQVSAPANTGRVRATVTVIPMPPTGWGDGLVVWELYAPGDMSIAAPSASPTKKTGGSSSSSGGCTLASEGYALMAAGLILLAVALRSRRV